MQYFLKITTLVSSNYPQTGNESVITRAQNDMLMASLTFNEFTEAVKSMHPDIASGPDGLNPAFFKHFWKLVGMEAFKCYQD